MVSTPNKFQLNQNRFNNIYILCTFQQIALCECWTAFFQKMLNVPTPFLRVSVLDLHTDYSTLDF